MYHLITTHQKTSSLWFVVLVWNRFSTGQWRTNTSTLTNISPPLTYTTIAPTQEVTVDQSDDVDVLYEPYILKDTKIQDAVISLQNTSVIIYNATITNTEISFSGDTYYTVFIKNCTFTGSEVEIQSANHCTIESCHFVIQNRQRYRGYNHVLRTYNIEHLYIVNTLFTHQNMGPYNDRKTSTEATNLGIKMEDVLLAKIQNCTFSGIRSETRDGTVMFLEKTNIFIISSEFYFNVANSGVIFAITSVNITNNNSSYISNHAVYRGGVFCLTDFIILANYDCDFQNNTSDYGGVLYAKDRTLIKSYDCLFQYNLATKFGSVIRMTDYCKVINEQVFTAQLQHSYSTVFTWPRGSVVNTKQLTN